MRSGPFRGLRAVLYKEFLHMRRDRMAIFFALLIPLGQMIVLGFAIDTNIRNINTVVFNQDNTQASRELLDRFRNSDTFHIVAFAQSDKELNDWIISGRARVGVKIPVDYSDQLLRRGTAQVLVLIDGSDSSVAGTALNVSTAIGLDESLRRVVGVSPRFAVDVRPKLLFNPDSRSPNFFLPGLLAVLLLFVTTFLTAVSIVREKEKGTLEQLFVTPVKPMGLLLGKLLPYLGTGIIALLGMLVFMRFAFQIPFAGSVWLIVLLSLPYLFVNLSLGLIISSIAGSQSEAIQRSVMIILPTIFFSGYIFPRETMPLVFYLFSFLVPGTYYVNISRGIILRGAGFEHLWTDGLVLLIMGVFLLFVAARRFRNKIIAV
ncbi:MAG TPA: ABC transporter permease [Candidatus Acidoferrales bacterium]